MIFRSDAEKADLAASWRRSDRAFFAGGACHILSHVYLLEYPHSGYHPFYIQPAPGFRGSHVLVSDGTTVFDYHGFSDHDRYMAHYFAKLRRLSPGWQAEVIPLEGSLVDPAFCSRYQHRLPTQYFEDPLPRATRFLRRLQKHARHS